ncbi:hypothetical protein BS47DRAFT_716733 [Hydnum rufescens UP504]|uniref:Uncharacterized protein n=1 Tax=Hydnum rufescens UP504 TaxID=1448309 RepID=A0A9P6B1S2_9AGAM|nr:hypothetical protein BS47DRAFT_716733 [Hydnum rufescens UP504]
MTDTDAAAVRMCVASKRIILPRSTRSIDNDHGRDKEYPAINNTADQTQKGAEAPNTFQQYRESETPWNPHFYRSLGTIWGASHRGGIEKRWCIDVLVVVIWKSRAYPQPVDKEASATDLGRTSLHGVCDWSVKIPMRSYGVCRLLPLTAAAPPASRCSGQTERCEDKSS